MDASHLSSNIFVKKISVPNVVSGISTTIHCENEVEWKELDSNCIVCLTSGIFSIHTPEESILVSPGMLLFIPAYCAFYQKCVSGSASMWCITVPQEKLTLDLKKICLLKSSNLLMGLAEKIVSWGKISETQKKASQSRLAMTFLDELAEAESIKHINIKIPTSSSLQEIALYIMNNPGDKKQIDFWAKKAGMSRRSFTMHFLKETGLSFAIWRQKIKLQKAVSDLSTGKTVKQVSLALGFSTPSAFTVVFKKQFGVSPKKYINSLSS